MRPNYAIGIDLGGTNVKIALVNKRGNILVKQTLITQSYLLKEDLISAVINKTEVILSYPRIKRKDIMGIGIGLPGLVDSERGIVHYFVNIKGWKNVPLAKIFRRHFNLPTFIDNDVNATTLAELRFGAGRGAKNLICLTLGTGVGGGVVVNGELYRGSTLSAGELGHIPLERDGLRCNCGGYGCVERYVGNNYLVENVKSQIRKGKRTIIAKLVNNKLSKITPRVITEAAKKGDKFAICVWRNTGENLGIVLAGIVNFFNPERIVIGGGVAKAGKLLFDSIIKTVRLRAMELPGKKVKIVRARLGEDAGVIGAAILAMRKREAR